jgi:mycothiol synthase
MVVQPRPYRDEQDIEAMKAVLIAGRQAGGPTYYIHVGDLSWWLRYLIKDEDHRQIIFLWNEEHVDADLIGWSLLSPSYRAFDVFVHPIYLGTEQSECMWTWTEERMGEIIREQGGNQVRTMWVGEHDAQLIALLERRGFARSDYHLLKMAHALEDAIPEPSLPPGFRACHVGGEHQVTQRAAVAHAAFGPQKTFEQYRQDYLTFMRSPEYNPELDLVVVTPDGRFGAFCICWLDTVNRVGLFEPVGTAPDFRRKGFGKAVLVEGLRRMRARGMSTAIVCVEHDNTAARRLYASTGFQVTGRIHTYAKEI